jgi:hypothetical protein
VDESLIVTASFHFLDKALRVFGEVEGDEGGFYGEDGVDGRDDPREELRGGQGWSYFDYYLFSVVGV